MLLSNARWAVVTLLISGVAMAESDGPAAIRDAWSKIYLDAAKEIVLTSKNSDDAFELVEKPLMRWHNPVREGETHGDFFVWKRGDEPVLVGTIFSYNNPYGGGTRVAAMEVHSLIKDDLRYEFRTLRGTLQGSNLDQFDIDIETPEALVNNPTRQLAQLRLLARSCKASTFNGSAEQPLRLMPQPLLQMDTKGSPSDNPSTPQAQSDPSKSTAALFAMVTGTDPELLLLIRSKPSDHPGKSSWQITPARFSDLPIDFSANGDKVWRRHTGTYPEPYAAHHGIFVRPADPR